VNCDAAFCVAPAPRTVSYTALISVSYQTRFTRFCFYTNLQIGELDWTIILEPCENRGKNIAIANLAAVFAGPVNSYYFSEMRDILPAARALSDAELMAAARQATSVGWLLRHGPLFAFLVVSIAV
jgi:hypothetical protein